MKIVVNSPDGTPAAQPVRRRHRHRRQPAPPWRHRRGGPPDPAAPPSDGARRLAAGLPLPALPPVAGVRLAAGAAGIRYKGRTDVLLAEFAAGTTVAGVFTRNLCPGAPVDWCRAALPRGAARGLVVNAGNANVFTGAAGRAPSKATADAAAALLGCPPSRCSSPPPA